MNYILVNKTNYDQSWTNGFLCDVITDQKRVLMIPLAYDEGWSSDAVIWSDSFRKGSKYYNDLIRPLQNYGIQDSQIAWFDYHTESLNSLSAKLAHSDLVCLAGAEASSCMDVLEDIGLDEILREYDGDVIGISAGAEIMLSSFVCWKDEYTEFGYRQGLGFLSGFYILPHFGGDVEQLDSLIRVIEESGWSVVIMPEKAGLLISESSLELLGDAFIADANDLDELYQLYHEAKD